METKANSEHGGASTKGGAQRLPHHYAVTATVDIAGDVPIDDARPSAWSGHCNPSSGAHL